MNRQRSTNQPTKWVPHYLICLACVTCMPSAEAEEKLAEFFAGNGSEVWSPLLWGWYDPSYLSPPQYIDGYVAGVSGPAGGGVNAWQIQNPGISGFEPRYFFFLQYPHQIEAARQNGWNMQTKAQLVEMQQGLANQGLAVTFDGRYYGVAIDKNSGGSLVAEIQTSATQTTTIVLESPAGASEYHDYELRSAPDTQLVSFFYDGELKYTWAGVAEDHPNTFEFGSLSDLGAGSMNFREAYSNILDAAPTLTEQGDFNGDGLVNLADYTLWRNTLGSTSLLAADGNGNQRIDAADYGVWKSHFGQQTSTSSTSVAGAEVPEPNMAALALLAAAVGIAAYKKGRNATYGRPALLDIAP